MSNSHRNTLNHLSLENQCFYQPYNHWACFVKIAAATFCKKYGYIKLFTQEFYSLVRARQELLLLYELLHTYTYFWCRSPGAGWAGITSRIDHFSDGGTPASTVLFELFIDFYPAPSPSCVAEDSQLADLSRFVLSKVANIFCWPLVRCSMDKRRSMISSPSDRLEAK